MKEKDFVDNYFSQCAELLLNEEVSKNVLLAKRMILKAQKKGGKLIFAGNGASASIASHASLDFTKQGKVNAVNFNEASFITAFANDYGYENWIQKALEFHCRKNDVLILISSSGTSQNVINAATYARENNIQIITFTGFSRDNGLRNLGNLNFWINSKSYNIIEGIHQIWLLCICDLIIGEHEYSVI